MMKISTGTLLAVAAMTFGGAAQADTFTGAGDGTSWEDAANWAGGVVPLNNSSGNTLINNDHQVIFDADTFAALSLAGNTQSATEYRILRLLMGDSTSGGANGTHSLTLDQGAGTTVRVTNSNSAVIGGRADKFSSLNIVSGTTNIEANRVRVGANTNGSGTINLSGGDLILGRGGLELGNLAGGGNGTLNITGGTFTTRTDAEIGDSGVFHVAGTGASTIGIGSHASGDGFWEQDAGGVLRTGIDASGITAILIDDVDDDGLGLQGNAVFADGSILDPYDLGGVTLNTWTTVMTWEGTLTDNGLDLSASSILAGWEKRVDGNNLQVQLTPEPGSIALVGLGALAMIRRRKA